MKNKEMNKCKKTKLQMTDKTALSVKPFRKTKGVLLLFLHGVFDNFLVGRSKVFVDFGVKSLGRKLANCFLLVEVGAPNGCRATFVGCFDDEVISGLEINEGSPFFFVKVTICGLSLHHGNTESRKNLEQKFIFQLSTLSPHGINERLSFH